MKPKSHRSQQGTGMVNQEEDIESSNPKDHFHRLKNHKEKHEKNNPIESSSR